MRNRSDESFTVPIAGSGRTASAPAGRQDDVLNDETGAISVSECVGEGFSIVDSSGAVRATFDEPICPDTSITIEEDGTITVLSGGKTLTPAPSPAPSPSP